MLCGCDDDDGSRWSVVGESSSWSSIVFSVEMMRRVAMVDRGAIAGLTDLQFLCVSVWLLFVERRVY